MSTSLQMRDIQKFYGSLHVVKDFNLDIQAGEFVTFLGPSGSGKTTALKMIAGFEMPSSGEILLGDRSIVDLPAHERGIGMVFQNYALFPHMTVAENVAFPMTVRGASRTDTETKVNNALNLVKMEQYKGRYPNQLSGGQQQRIALARAIVFNPSLLLMDEPLGALDRNLREHMKIEIMRIQKELNMTVVFVTHDQDEALTMSDRIAVINEGRLAQVSDSRTLYRRPENRFVASFVGESNLLPCNVVKSDGEYSLVEIGGRIVGLAQRNSANSPKDLHLFIRPEHMAINEVQAGETSEAGLLGTVENVLFLGEMTRYLVRCGDQLVVVKRQNADDFSFTSGSNVELTWQPDKALLLA